MRKILTLLSWIFFASTFAQGEEGGVDEFGEPEEIVNERIKEIEPNNDVQEEIDEPPPEPEPPRENRRKERNPDYDSNSKSLFETVEGAAEQSENDLDKNAPRKSFTQDAVQKMCRPLEGKLISFYDNVFRVKNCRRQEIVDSDLVYQLLKQGNKITDVSADVIAALPLGERLEKQGRSTIDFSCKSLEGKYITYSNVNVYYVTGCKKYKFPDWISYLDHRKKSPFKEIVVVPWNEFLLIEEGQELASAIDVMMPKLDPNEGFPDIIPIDEACQPVNGKVVSYYSKIYKIEECRKRVFLDPTRVSLSSYGRQKIVELSSEQWVSIPNGEPIDNTLPELPPKK